MVRKSIPKETSADFSGGIILGSGHSLLSSPALSQARAIHKSLLQLLCPFTTPTQQARGRAFDPYRRHFRILRR